MTEADIENASNAKLDSIVVRIDRTASSKGYPLVTFDEMEIDPPAKAMAD